MSRKITIEFLGDSKDLQRSMDDAESKGGRLTGTLKKVGKMAAVGLAAGAVAGGVALVKMTQGAIEDEAAQKRLEGVLKNTTGATDKQVAAVEDWITAQGKALGVADDDLRPALEKLAASTGSVEEAQRQAALAMDVAAGRGVSLEQVTKAMERANNGNVAGLSRLGIATKNAAGETISMEEAQKRLADVYGGAAASKAETLQGKMDRLKLILAETGETIGSKLIPAVTVAADWFLNKGLPAVQAFGGWLGDTLPPIFERIRGVVQTVMGGVQGDVGGGLAQVQSIFSSVTSIISSLWDSFGSTLIDYATKAFANVQQIIGGALTVIQGVFQTFSALLQGDWSGAWEGVKRILSGAWEIIKGIVKQAMNVVSTAMELGWIAAKGVVSAAWSGIKELVSAGIGKVVEWVSAIPGKLSNALSSLRETVGGLFRDAMDAGKDKVTGIGQTIIGWIAEIPGKLREKLENFKNAGAALIGGFVDGMKNAGGVIEGIAGNVWSAVKTLLNGAISKINAALEFTISIPGKDITINPPDILALKTGGRVGANSPRMAWIGDANEPETVLRDSQLSTLMRGAAEAATGGSGGAASVVVDLRIGGAVIERLLIQHTRDTGRPLQVRALGPA